MVAVGDWSQGCSWGICVLQEILMTSPPPNSSPPLHINHLGLYSLPLVSIGALPPGS